MAEELERLKLEVEKKSMGIVAKELKVSKATVSLVVREKYPNPYKIYEKVKERYGQKIIGADVGADAASLFKEIEDE